MVGLINNILNGNKIQVLQKENELLKQKLSVKQEQINRVNKYWKNKLKSMSN